MSIAEASAPRVASLRALPTAFWTATGLFNSEDPSLLRAGASALLSVAAMTSRPRT